MLERVDGENRGACRGRGSSFGMEACTKKQKVLSTKVDCWARFFALFREYNLQRLPSMQEDSTEGEEMRRQQRMKVMKDMTKKIRSRCRMDAENRWWVTELLAAACEKAWVHPGREETMQKWYKRMKKRMRRWRKCINKSDANDKECGGKCWTFA